MKINNIDLDKAITFVEEVKKDKSKAIKTKKVEGAWNFEEGKPQFISTLEHASGTTVVEVDGPPFMGGAGIKPDILCSIACLGWQLALHRHLRLLLQRKALS